MTTEPPVRVGPGRAYDGSELAKLAIDEAGRRLRPGRDAIVLTVWQPFDIGFERHRSSCFMTSSRSTQMLWREIFPSRNLNTCRTRKLIHFPPPEMPMKIPGTEPNHSCSIVQWFVP